MGLSLIETLPLGKKGKNQDPSPLTRLYSRPQNRHSSPERQARQEKSNPLSPKRTRKKVPCEAPSWIPFTKESHWPTYFLIKRGTVYPLKFHRCRETACLIRALWRADFLWTPESHLIFSTRFILMACTHGGAVWCGSASMAEADLSLFVTNIESQFFGGNESTCHAFQWS